MTISRKYGRTYHYPFSPGTTSDDRINHQYWNDISAIKSLIHTEKLDGENNCLNRYGVFARSHAAPTVSPWTHHLRSKWELIKNELGELEVFGENVYAIHSIEYQRLTHYFYVFAIREYDRWLSWEETKFYAALLDFPTVPELEVVTSPTEKQYFEHSVLSWSQQESRFGSVDVQTQQPCSMEGIVTRNAAEYAVENFATNVFKYVRKNHVKTDEHWSRNWRKVTLTYTSLNENDHVDTE